MPGMEMPVRMTTAMLFFVAGGVAAYFSLQNPVLWWISECSYAFFVALGPLHWAKELYLLLPWTRRRRSEYYRYIEDTLLGDIGHWLLTVGQFLLMGYALYRGYSELSRLTGGDVPSGS